CANSLPPGSRSTPGGDPVRYTRGTPKRTARKPNQANMQNQAGAKTAQTSSTCIAELAQNSQTTQAWKLPLATGITETGSNGQFGQETASLGASSWRSCHLTQNSRTTRRCGAYPNGSETDLDGLLMTPTFLHSGKARKTPLSRTMKAMPISLSASFTPHSRRQTY